MSSKSVLPERCAIVSSKGVLQECHLRVSAQGVPQVGSLENVTNKYCLCYSTYVSAFGFVGFILFYYYYYYYYFLKTSKTNNTLDISKIPTPKMMIQFLRRVVSITAPWPIAASCLFGKAPVWLDTCDPHLLDEHPGNSERNLWSLKSLKPWSNKNWVWQTIWKKNCHNSHHPSLKDGQ